MPTIGVGFFFKFGDKRDRTPSLRSNYGVSCASSILPESNFYANCFSGNKNKDVNVMSRINLIRTNANIGDAPSFSLFAFIALSRSFVIRDVHNWAIIQ